MSKYRIVNLKLAKGYHVSHVYKACSSSSGSFCRLEQIFTNSGLRLASFKSQAAVGAFNLNFHAPVHRNLRGVALCSARDLDL